MPTMDGIQATKLIREAETDSHIPIVAMTAHAMKGDREACLAAGMDDYIAKPIDYAKLIKLVDHVGSTDMELKKMALPRNEWVDWC